MKAGSSSGLTMSRKTFWILAGILVFAFMIRLYHINFPAIGYHNMKENVFISMAKNMVESGDFFQRKVSFLWNWTQPDVRFTGHPFGQFTAWQIAGSHKLFGDAFFLGAARFINVLFFLCAVVFAFRISEELTKRVSVSLLAALILAFLPLGNFFSRNLQSECVCFLMMLIVIDCGLRFDRTYGSGYLLIAGLASAVILLGKGTFFIGMIPLLFAVSLGRLFKLFQIPRILGFFSLLVLPVLIAAVIFRNDFGCDDCHERISYLRIFSGKYWRDFGPTLFAYTIYENFTWFYAVPGILGAVWILVCERDFRLKRFIMGWILALILYGMALSDLIHQHNYYQMPFLFLVAFCAAYFLWHAALAINKVLKGRAGYMLLAGFIMISLPDVYAATMRQYDYVLFGQDVAGDYLRRHVPVGKPFFHYTWSQGYGVCTYADRRCGWPADLDDFKRKEKELGVEYLSVYSFPYFATMAPDIKKYVETNYHVVHIGFTSGQKDGFVPWTVILKKGGSLDVDEFLKKKPLRLNKVYGMLKSSVPYLVAEE